MVHRKRGLCLFSFSPLLSFYVIYVHRRPYVNKNMRTTTKKKLDKFSVHCLPLCSACTLFSHHRTFSDFFLNPSILLSFNAPGAPAGNLIKVFFPPANHVHPSTGYSLFCSPTSDQYSQQPFRRMRSSRWELKCYLYDLIPRK